MVPHRSKLFLLMVLLTSAALTACGGGGGGGGEGGGANPSGGGGTTAPATYLFYQGSLVAVDPATPTLKTFIETDAVQGAEVEMVGSYNAAARTMSDWHTRSVFYDKAGKIYRVNALKSGSLTPVQVSSESAATGVCSRSVFSDFNNPDNSAYMYSLPGADGTCWNGDDVWRMVTAGMGIAQPPVPVPAFSTSSQVEGLYNPATGARIGFLAVEGSNLNRYDVNFANPVLLLAGVNNWHIIAWDLFDRIFLVVDHGSERKLYVYHVATQQLSSPLYTSTENYFPWPATWPADQDATHAFFSDGSAVYRLPLDGSASAGLWVDDPSVVSDLVVTASKVVYVVQEFVPPGFATKDTLKAVDRNAPSAPVPYFSEDGIMRLFAVNGDWVYYNSYEPSMMTPQAAGGIKVDTNSVSNLTRTANAEWIGHAWAEDFGPESSDYSPRILRASGYTAVDKFAGATIRAYDTANNTVLAELGSLPTGNPISSVDFNGTGDYVIGAALLPMGGEVFTANVTSAGSLTNLTNTPSVDEGPVW